MERPMTDIPDPGAGRGPHRGALEPPAGGFNAAAAGLTDRDYAANTAAEYVPANWADGTYRPPSIRIGAIFVFAYAASRILHVNVGSPDIHMRLAVQGETVHRHSAAGLLLPEAGAPGPDPGTIAAMLAGHGWADWENASMLGFRITAGVEVTTVEFAPGPGRMTEAAAMRGHLADATDRAAAQLRAAGYAAAAEAGYVIIRAGGRPDAGPGAGYDVPVNAAAEYLPARWDDDTWCPPAVRIGDVLVFAYLRQGILQVSVDLDDVDPATSPFAVYGAQRCVPMRLEVHGQTVFSAFQPGGHRHHPARGPCDPATGRP
jgi:hypothetical protein